MLISVVIPIYNVEPFLAACLDSILSQTFQDFEVIAINDGSKDASFQVLESYVHKFSSIRVIDTVNQGVSVARNLGLAASSGDYVYFMDSDDCLSQNAFEIMVAEIQTNSLDILFFEAKAFTEDPSLDLIPHNYKRSDPVSLSSSIVNGQQYFSSAVNFSSFLASPCCYISRRSSIDKIRFAAGIVHEDNLFAAQLFNSSLVQRVKAIPDALFLRRIRADSIMTSTKSTAHLNGYLACYQGILDLLPYAMSLDVQKAIKKLAFEMLERSILVSLAIPNFSASIKQRWTWFLMYKQVGRLSFRSFVMALTPELFKLQKKLRGKDLN
jgi:glycosyltransferase involved in cell wall biosynthesis